jgi:hypothetical protein
MKVLLVPLAIYFATSMAVASASFHGVSTNYGYFSHYLPAPISSSNSQVVYSSVYNNQTSIKAAELFDTLQTPMTEQYIPEQIYGQPYGGVDAAYYSYTKELVAGGVGIKCSIRSKSQIGNRKFAEIFEETNGLYCYLGYADLKKPDFNLPVRHAFTDAVSNPLIQSVLQNGGALVIDGRDSFWHQFNPKSFPATLIQITCTKNDCTFVSEKK